MSIQVEGTGTDAPAPRSTHAAGLVARPVDYFSPAYSSATPNAEIEVSPPFVEFKAVTTGATYKTVLHIKNLGATQRIKVGRTHARSPFSVEAPPVSNVHAHGIAFPVHVSFKVPDVSDSPTEQYTDVLELQAESGVVCKVPLRAFPALPSLRYPAAIYFGSVVSGSTATRTFEIINASSERGASLSLSVKTEIPLRISTQRALLSPATTTTAGSTGGETGKSNKLSVTVRLDASNLKPGSYRSVIHVDGPGAGSKVIDVIVECVEHGVRMVLPHPGHPQYVRPAGLLPGDRFGTAAQGDGSPTITTTAAKGSVLPHYTSPVSDSVDLGAVFFGQRTCLHAILVNDGPEPITFSLFKGSQADSALNEVAGGAQASSVAFSGMGGGSISAGAAGKTGPQGGPAFGLSRVYSDEGGENEEEEEDGRELGSADDPVLDEAAERDFHISPSQGSLPPYGEVLLTLTYTATDRRLPPLFRAQAAQTAEETQRALAGLPPSPPKHVPGLGRYPGRSSRSLSPTGPRDSSGLNGQDDALGLRDSMRRNSRGRSVGSTWRPPKGSSSTRRDAGEIMRERHGLSEVERQELYGRVAPMAEMFSTRLALVVPERNMTQGIELTARAVRPSVSVSQAVVDFSQIVPVNGRKDASIVITNETELLPVKWRIQKTTQYFAEPDHGTLPAQGVAHVQLAYIPSKLGPANDVLPLVIEPGNGAPVAPLNPRVLQNGDVEPPIKGSKSAKLVEAASAGTNALLAVPIAVTAGAMAPDLPGSVHPAAEGLQPPMSPLKATLSATLSSQFHRAAHLSARHAGSPLSSLEPVKDWAPQSEGLVKTGMLAMSVAGGAPLYACNINPVEVAEEKQAEYVKKAPPLSKPKKHAWEDAAAARGLGKEDDLLGEEQYARTLGRQAFTQVNKDKYSQWVQGQSLQRSAVQARAHALQHGAKPAGVETDLDPRSLGMPEGKDRSIRPPVLGIPGGKTGKEEPLWLVRPIGPDGTPQLRLEEIQAKMNQDKLVKTKFKPAPTTAAEKAECSLELTQEQLSAVVCGPSAVQYGDVYVLETVVKNWSVYNGLGQAIFVELKVPEGCAELCTTPLLSQVIPPGSLAGFDLPFMSTVEHETWRTSVTYLVNGKHTSRFLAAARALPLVVTFSRSHLSLAFPETGPHAVEQYCSDSIELRNPCRAPADYVWSIRDRDAPFEIEPATGVIPAGGVAYATVSYRPFYASSTESAFAMAIKGGREAEPQVLTVQGELVDVKLQPSVKVADFDTLGLGLRKDVVVSLRNQGSTYAMIYVSPDSLPPNVTVEPLIARVEAGESLEMSLSLNAEVPYPFVLDPTQHAVQISVRGGKGLFLPISATVLMPDVVVLEDAIQFGNVTLGNKARRRFTIENRTEVPVELSVDFRRFRRFRVKPPSRPTRALGSSVDDDGAASMSVGEESMGGQFMLLDSEQEVLEQDADLFGGGTRTSSPPTKVRPEAAAAGGQGSDDDAGQFAGDDEDDDEYEDDEEENALSDQPRFLPRKFRCKVGVDAVVTFDVEFRPVEVEAYDFALPVFVRGVPDIEGLDRRVTAVGVKPRLKLESMRVDFCARTWFKEAERRQPYERKFRMFNADPSAPVTWSADTLLLTAYPPALGPEGAGPGVPLTVFAWSPSSGAIPIGGTCEVTVTFCPQEAKAYRNTVPLFLEDSQECADGQPYLELELHGLGVPPCLTFDQRELILPPVPIGAVAQGEFILHNHGYDHLPLKWRLPANEITSAVVVPLQVTFPDGDAVSSAKDKVRVQVAFSSDKPLSFTILLEFNDAEGARYALPISGTADASLMTLEEYWQLHKEELYIETLSGRAPQLLSSARPTDATIKAKAGLGAMRARAASPSHATRERSFPSQSVVEKAEGMIPEAKSVLPHLPEGHARHESLWAPPIGSPGRDSRALVNWLSQCILRSPISSWPEDVVSAGGKQVFDLVEVLSGRPIPGRLSKGFQLPGKNKDRVRLLYKQASDFLLHMKTMGGAVHHVRPECLLSARDFLLVRKYGHTGVFTPGQPPFGAVQHRYLSPQESKTRDVQLIKAFPALSHDAWTAVMWQAVRLLMLSRVTLRAMIATPGMALDEGSKRVWGTLLDAEKEVASRVESARADALQARSKTVSLSPPPRYGGTAKRSLSGTTKTAAGRKGGMGLTENSIMLYNPHAPAPGGEMEASVMLSASQVQATAVSSQGTRAPVSVHAADSVAPATSAAAVPAARDPRAVLDDPLTAKVVDPAILAERTVVDKGLKGFLAADGGLSPSNAYSVHEGLLLRWLSYHHNRMCPKEQARKVVDFVADLKDGVVLVRLLLSHAPDLGLPGRVLDVNAGHVHMQPETARHERENADAVMEALKYLGLEAPFSAPDLAPEAFAAMGISDDAPLWVEQDEEDPMADFNASLTALQMSIASMAGQKQKEVGDKRAASGRSLSGTRTRTAEGAQGGQGQGGDGAGAPVGSALDAIRLEKPKPAKALFESGGALMRSLPGTTRCKLTGVGNPRDFLLWVMWLWQSLPACVPKATVDFKCALGKPTTKYITLTNPTKRTITYSVSLEADGAKSVDAALTGAALQGAVLAAGPFTVNQRSVTLQAGSTMQLPVRAHPMFSKPSHAKVVLRSAREGPVAPSTLVFALRTLVTTRPPITVKTAKGVTYAQTMVEVDVKNPTDVDANFLIKLVPLSSDSAPGSNMMPDAQASLLEAYPSPYVIAGAGTEKDPWRLPLHLRPGFIPPVAQVDSNTAAITGMDDATLAMYGLTKEDQAHAAYVAAKAVASSVTGGLQAVVPAAGGSESGTTGEAASGSHMGNSEQESPEAAFNGLTRSQAQLVGRADKKAQPAAFFCKWKDITIKAGSTKRLTLQFLPFTPGMHRCAVVLVDRSSSVAELVYEVSAEADSPNPTLPKLSLRAPIAKTVERLLHVPQINAPRERAWDMTIGRLERQVRPGEVSARQEDRHKEVDIRERCLKGLREQLKPGPGGKGGSAAQTAKAAIKAAASALLGTFYEVSVDSPFYEVPSLVYIPAPTTALPAMGAGGDLNGSDWDVFSTTQGGGGSDAGRSRGGKASRGGGKPGSVAGVPTSMGRPVGGATMRVAFGAADVAEYDPERPVMHRDVLEQACLPQLEVAPGPLGPPPGTMTIAGMPPSQLKEVEPLFMAGAPPPYKPCTLPASVADALISGKDEALLQLSRVPLVLRPKGPGTYPCRVTLTSAKDVRVYEVELTVEAAGPSRMITFSTTVGVPILQALPVSNPTDTPWDLEIAFKPARRFEEHYFSGPERVHVPARGTATVNVVWNPAWICDQVVTMHLAPNALAMSTLALQRGGMLPGDTSIAPITFDMRGVGEEPLALDTLHMHTRVRGVVQRELKLYNYSKHGPLVLTPSMDVPYLSGPPSLTVPAARAREAVDEAGEFRGDTEPGVAVYPLVFSPMHGGSWTGQVTFTDTNTARYQWYAVEATADAGAPAGRTSIATIVRQAAQVSIELVNADERPCTMEVTLVGEGLVGEPTVTLPGGGTGVYTCLYAPFFPTPGWDAQPAPTPAEGLLVFSSGSGEMTYQLDLIALPAPAQALGPIHAPIGGSRSLTVKVENPTATAAQVRAHVENSRVFSVDAREPAPAPTLGRRSSLNISLAAAQQTVVQGMGASTMGRLGSHGGGMNSSITIPPFGSREVCISYSPSLMGQEERGRVVLSSPSLGEWVYDVTGIGGGPEPAQPATLACIVGQVSSHTLRFRNPFSGPLTVDVELVVAANDGPEDGELAGGARGAAGGSGSRMGSARSGVSSIAMSAVDKAVAASSPPLTLLKRIRGVRLPGFATLQIPMAFAPLRIGETVATVRVSGVMTEGQVSPTRLDWVYPVQAVGEAPLAATPILLHCTARASCSVPVTLPLLGLDIPHALARAASSGAASTASIDAKGYTVEVVPMPDTFSSSPAAPVLTAGTTAASMLLSAADGPAKSMAASVLLQSRAQLATSGSTKLRPQPTGVFVGSDEARAEAVARTAAIMERAVNINTHGMKMSLVPSPEVTALMAAAARDEEGGRGVLELLGDELALCPALHFTVDLHPPKAWEGRAELIVRHATGGRWRFRMKLSFPPPPVDGVVRVEAAIGSQGTALVRLANAFPTPAPFTARLSLESPSEFRVSPSSGVMPPSMGSGGSKPANTAAVSQGQVVLEESPTAHTSEIAVSFTPREHGKHYKGRLIIETESYTWVYILHGSPPSYTAPVPAGIQVDDKMDPRVMATMRAAHEAGRRKNYVASAGSGAGLMSAGDVSFGVPAGPGSAPGTARSGMSGRR